MATTGASSDFLENELLDHVLGGAAYTAPATLYLALFTDASSEAELEAGTLTNEATGNGYARQTVAFDAAATGSTSNTAAVEFANMPAGTFSRVAVMDGDTEGAGNVLFFATLDTARTLESGDTLKFSAGQLTFTLD